MRWSVPSRCMTVAIVLEGQGWRRTQGSLKEGLKRTNIQQTSRTLAMQWHRSINHTMCYAHQEKKLCANDLPMVPMACQLCQPYHFCMSIILAPIAVQCTCHYKACALLAWGLAGLRISEEHQNFVCIIALLHYHYRNITMQCAICPLPCHAKSKVLEKITLQ